MGWNIKVWHEDAGEDVRLIVEAGSEVPQDVIATVAEAYWTDEVQYADDDWAEDEDEPNDGPRFHG